MHRAALSRSFAALVTALVLGGWLWSLDAMAARDEQGTEAQAITIAQVVTDAAVNAKLAPGMITAGSLAPVAVTDLRGDVRQLRRSGQLSGLAVWALDGRRLFQDVPSGWPELSVADSELRRAREGRPWTAAVGPSGAGQLRVLLPTAAPGSAASTPTALVEVVVPESAASKALAGQSLRQQISLGVVAVLLLGGLLWLRRGLLRREQHARIDRLTGLLNRRALHEDARRLLAVTTPDRPTALLLVDLSQFKTVNDTLGHAAGDLLLTQVATTLRSLVRPEDQVFRLGGDEFAVLLLKLPDAAAAQLRAEHLLARLRKTTFGLQGIGMSVDASIGVALAPVHGRQIEELLKHADVAMYQAKAGHRGTTLYDPQTDRNAVSQLELTAELRRALDNREFVLHYQPKISLPDQRVYGVEALVRWAHPVRGLLPPADFLPLMEETGLMQSLSEWVVREAVHQAASWRRAGTPLKMAVNLSPRSVLNPALPGKVLAILSGADLPASFLELEITETAIMTDPQRAASILGQLRARGVDISVDDFGTGYTSLALLRQLPVSAVKIDRSLVDRTLDSPQDQAVIRAITDLGHSLDLRVIAEGVETGGLLDELISLGCDRAQGYLISRPLPPAALEGWLANRDSAVDDSPVTELAPQRPAS